MATMNPSIQPNFADDNKGLAASVPAWGSYLYQNFLLPAFSPSEWMNTTPNAVNPTNQMDYFNSQPQPRQQQQMPVQAQRLSLPYSQSGPSDYYQQQSYYPATSIPTSLLVSHNSSSTISPSVDVVDSQIIQSPSPISQHVTPAASPKQRGVKRRASSLESDSHDEQEHDIAEGVERDGMIWGMRVEDYRALSARERKRVRNRISARTFRAKRKEHLSSLEIDLESKDLQVKAANDEAARLRAQVAELKGRLSKYERV